jgi:hypothetical protein
MISCSSVIEFHIYLKFNSFPLGGRLGRGLSPTKVIKFEVPAFASEGLCG